MGELIALRRKSLMAILCMNECQREEIRGNESNLNGLYHMLDVPDQHPAPEHEVCPYANHQDISDINVIIMVIAECTSHFQERVRSGGVKPPSRVHNRRLALFCPARIIEYSY